MIILYNISLTVLLEKGMDSKEATGDSGKGYLKLAFRPLLVIIAISLGAAVVAGATRLASAHLAAASAELAKVDWGAMFSLGVFMIMIGVALAIPIGAHHRKNG